MTSARPTAINDDHGDQFPGAVPAPAAPATAGLPHERLVRMHAAYTEKVNSAVQAGREDLAHELAGTFDEELTRHRERQTSGRRTPIRTYGGRPPGQATGTLGRMGRFTRRSLDRLDRYTTDVFTPRPR